MKTFEDLINDLEKLQLKRKRKNIIMTKKCKIPAVSDSKYNDKKRIKALKRRKQKCRKG